MAPMTGWAYFAAGMLAALLPYRHWRRLPVRIPIETAAFVSGIATVLAGAAVGIPGFLRHAEAFVSLGTGAVIDQALKGNTVSLSPAFGGISIFTFLLFTPPGWLTVYLLITGTVRAGGAWFDDPVGDPLLTGIDAVLSGALRRWRTREEIRTREALEGPEVADRLVSGAAAGIPDCDFAIVASRRKAGWESGVVVFTEDACYRIGTPVERTVNGRLRTLYPLTEHRDLEAVRKSVRYDLPRAAKADRVLAAGVEPRADGS